jgi:hypothetical protein
VKFLLVYLDTDPTPPPDPPLTVTTTFLPNGQVGVAYSATLTATGGTAPYTWETIEPLPDGLSIVGSAITGTPTTEGNFTPRVRVTDSVAASADSGTLPVTIVAAGTVLTITTTTIPNGQVNQPYVAQLAAVGGTEPYTWSVQSGSLPAGLSLNASTGAITGTPTTAGSANLIFRVTDAVAATDDSGVYPLVIAGIAAVRILTTNLADAEVDVAYSRALSVSGGSGVYDWSVTAGSLPTGLSLHATTGVISGTPTVQNTFAFTVKAADDADAGNFDEVDLTLEIVAAGLEGPHDFFETIIQDATNVGKWTLRSNAELDSLRDANAIGSFRYIWPDDDYDDPHDAAQLYIRPNGISVTGDPEPLRNIGDIPGSDQLRFPVPNLGDGRYLIVWDFYMGVEFILNNQGPDATGAPGGLNDIKMFRRMITGNRMWTQTCGLDERASFNDPQALGIAADSWFGGATSGTLPPPMTRREPLWWTGTAYTQQRNQGLGWHYRHGVWSRWWMEWRQNVAHTDFTHWNSYYGVTVPENPSSPTGKWNMVTLWVADEGRDPVCIIKEMPLSWQSDWTNQLNRFDYEFDSSDKGFTGPFYGYGRNVAMFFNYTFPAEPLDDTTMFKRPRR